MRSNSALPHPTRRRLLALLTVLVAILAFNAGVANALDITSAGPLTKVTTTPDLNCAVNHVGDASGEFYGSTACGTFVTDGTNLYGPAAVPAGGSATSAPGYVAWTPVSQNGPTGTGTASDPYKIVTVVTGGPFTVTQTDSYIVGQEVVRTDVQVTSSTNVSAIIYRAGDCYLQDSDSGLGRLDAGIAPTCVARPDSAQPDRIEQWYPLTAGSNYMVDEYDTVWAAIGSKQPFPNTVNTGADGAYDNGGGVSWTKIINAGTTTTLSSLMVFSPTGIVPVSVTKTVTPGTVTAGGTVTYTITAQNPGAVAAPINAIIDDLPAGFTYVTGSTSGATTANPTISGRELTWSQALTIPAASSSGPGSLTISFQAVVSTTPGTYTNSATITADLTPVIGAVDVAPVTVTAPTTPPSTTPPSTTPPTTPTTTPTRAATAPAATPVSVQPTYTG